MVTWNGKQQKLYVDGKPVATGQPAGPLLQGTGVRLTTTQETLHGDLDDVRIYDRALTDAEIAALAASK